MTAVGNNVARKDGIGKATGRAQYADDLVFPGMLHGRTVRSTIPRGRVRAVRLEFDQAGFTVADHHDIPGRNIVESGLARADLVIEGTYRTGHQEHVYIETNGVIAVPEDDGVVVYGSMQCPFYALKALRSL